MEQKKIERINELARKAKTPQGLTPEQLKQNLPIVRLKHDLRLARARAIVVDSAKPL